MSQREEPPKDNPAVEGFVEKWLRLMGVETGGAIEMPASEDPGQQNITRANLKAELKKQPKDIQKWVKERVNAIAVRAFGWGGDPVWNPPLTGRALARFEAKQSSELAKLRAKNILRGKKK
jgi:hypothetical protein